MSDIGILQEMIKDAAKVSLTSVGNRKQVTLTESQQAGSSVTIYGLPDEVVVIKADAFRSPDTVFNGSRGECKRADFVIVADTVNRKIILCIEMKATKGPLQEIIHQLTGTRCFVAYCREIGLGFWNKRDFLDGYTQRFITIGHTSIPKKKTRISRQEGAHDRPDRMLKIDWPHYLEFNHLAGA
ncbi:MAG: hypothetical protein IMZ61_09350 [Planctomycetes bacterium]|nr:hypothetical protein [Planctomycetota bacterium]